MPPFWNGAPPDASALAANGHLGLAALEAWGFFPFTDHVEVLARFDRR